MSSAGHPGPVGPPGYNKKKWTYQHHIRPFFWDRSTYDRMLDRKLDSDDEFVEWCWQHDCNIHGCWVECPDDEAALLFTMRWL